MRKTALSFLMLFVLLVNVNTTFANGCLIIENELTDIIDSSQFIFEGTIVEQTPFWSADFNDILTANKISIEQGFDESNFVYLITEGGKIDEVSMLYNPSLQLNIGDSGLFMANYAIEINPLLNTSYQFKSTFGPQGFFKAIDETANNVSKSIDYNLLIEQINNKKDLSLKTKPTNQIGNFNRTLVPVINNFTPTTISAGDFQELTINGSGFGLQVGSAAVLMQNNGSTNANDLITVPAVNITYWSDNQIRLLVPGNNVENNDRGAGTGRITVRNSIGQTTISNNILNINIHKNISGNSEIDVTSNNSNGFVDIYASNNLINAGALPAIERAIAEWNCKTNINFRYAGPTALTCNTNDGINIISFDNNCPITSLASTRTTTSKCSNEEAFLIDADIIFSASTNWNFGPSPTASNQYDFESTILHELGHLHQLGHVLNNNDLMYPLLPTGTDIRSITPDALQGGLEITSTSVIENACGPSPIQPFNSSNCAGSSPYANINANLKTICIGENINFYDASLNNPTSWFWTFEGGSPSTSNLQNPVINFPNEGVYNVTLTVSNAFGSSTNTFTDYIATEIDCCPSPGNFQAISVTETNANINWQSIVSAEEYVVRIKSINNTEWTSFTTSINFGFLSGLSACTTYEVQVATLCPLIGSAGVLFGSSNYFTTEGCVGCDFPPQSFAFNTTSVSTLLTWDIVSQAESYTVRYKRTDNSSWFNYNSQFPLAILFGLTPCTNYEFQVQSICADGSSTYSNSFTLQTLCERKGNDNELQNLGIEVFPNPAKDNVTVSFTNTEVPTHLEIIDITGQIISVQSVKQNHQKINLHFLNEGQYFIRAKNSEKIISVIPLSKFK